MKLSEINYHSIEANNEYWSVSMFKEFKDCEARGLAQIRGEYERPASKAFLEGGYVDAHFAGTLTEYLTDHPEIVNKRSGELKAEFVKARAAIEAAERSEFFMEFCGGEKQVILTGEIFGTKWKAKPDFLVDDKIVDLKYMRDIKPVWSGGEMRPFVDAYGYDIQGYVYQQIVYQHTGRLLPFYLAVITKEDPADLYVIQIPQWRLNPACEVVKYYVHRFEEIKKGELDPIRCGACAYCRQTKKLDHVTQYDELLEMQ